MSQEQPDFYQTTDMSIAAWLRAKGIRLVAVQRLPDRKREFAFTFHDPKRGCDDLALEFLNSDAYAFDTALRALKKMCFSPSEMTNAKISPSPLGRRG